MRSGRRTRSGRISGKRWNWQRSTSRNWWRCGRQCMKGRKHRVLTKAKDMDAALARARQFEGSHEDRRAVRAKYEAVGDRVVVYLSDGVIVSIPREYLQGLHRGTRNQLSDVEV